MSRIIAKRFEPVEGLTFGKIISVDDNFGYLEANDSYVGGFPSDLEHKIGVVFPVSEDVNKISPIYLIDDIDKLSDLLKTYENRMLENYYGLEEVPFTLDRDKFEMGYNVRINQAANEILHVSTDLKFVYQMVKNSKIRYHHLACTANVGKGSDAALCIRVDHDGVKHTYTVPGLNYVRDEPKK